jgi:hypothetical protein
MGGGVMRDFSTLIHMPPSGKTQLMACILLVLLMTALAGPLHAQGTSRTLSFLGDTLQFLAPAFPDRTFRKSIQTFAVERTFDTPGATYLKAQGPRLRAWSDAHNLDSWTRFLLVDSLLRVLAPDIPRSSHEVAAYLTMEAMQETAALVGDGDFNWKLGIRTCTISDDRASLVGRDTVVLPLHRSFNAAANPYVRYYAHRKLPAADLSVTHAPRFTHLEVGYRAYHWWDGGKEYDDTLYYDAGLVSLLKQHLKVRFENALHPACSPTLMRATEALVQRIQARHPEPRACLRALLSFARQAATYKADRGSFRGDDCIPPDRFVAEGMGDCEDFSLFFGMLLRMAGFEHVYLLSETHAAVAVHLAGACDHPDPIPLQGKCYLICDPTDPTDQSDIGMRDSRHVADMLVLPGK